MTRFCRRLFPFLSSPPPLMSVQLLGASTAFLHINIHSATSSKWKGKKKKSRGKNVYMNSAFILGHGMTACFALCLLMMATFLFISLSFLPSSYLQIHFFVSAFSLLNAWMKSSLHSLFCVWISALRYEHKKENETFTFLACCFCSLHPSLSLSPRFNDEWRRSVGFEIIEMCKALTRKCLFLKGASMRAF